MEEEKKFCDGLDGFDDVKDMGDSDLYSDEKNVLCLNKKVVYRKFFNQKTIFDVRLYYPSFYKIGMSMNVLNANKEKIYAFKEKCDGTYMCEVKSRIAVENAGFFYFEISHEHTLYKNINYSFIFEKSNASDTSSSLDYYGDKDSKTITTTNPIVEIKLFWEDENASMLWNIQKSSNELLEGLFFSETNDHKKVLSGAYSGGFNGKEVIVSSKNTFDMFYKKSFSYTCEISSWNDNETVPRNDQQTQATRMSGTSGLVSGASIASLNDVDWYVYQAPSENGVLHLTLDGHQGYDADVLLQMSLSTGNTATPYAVFPGEEGPGDPYLGGTADVFLHGNNQVSAVNAINFVDVYVPVFRNTNVYVLIHPYDLYDDVLFSGIKNYSEQQKYSLKYDFQLEKDDLDKTILKEDVNTHPRLSSEDALRQWPVSHVSSKKNLSVNEVPCVNQKWPVFLGNSMRFSCREERFGAGKICEGMFNTGLSQACVCGLSPNEKPDRIDEIPPGQVPSSWSFSLENGFYKASHQGELNYQNLKLSLTYSGGRDLASYVEISAYQTPPEKYFSFLPVQYKIFTHQTKSSTMTVSFSERPFPSNISMELDVKRNKDDRLCREDNTLKNVNEQPFLLLQEQNNQLCVCCFPNNGEGCGVTGLRDCVQPCVWPVHSSTGEFPPFSIIANPHHAGVQNYEGPVSVVARFTNENKPCLESYFNEPPLYPIQTQVLFLAKEEAGSSISTGVVSNTYLSHVWDQDYYSFVVPQNNILYSSFDLTLSTLSNAVEPRMEVMRGSERIYIGPSEGFSDIAPCTNNGVFDSSRASCDVPSSEKTYTLTPRDACTYLNSTANTVHIWVNDFALNDADPQNPYSFSVKMHRGCPLGCPLSACKSVDANAVCPP